MGYLDSEFDTQASGISVNSVANTLLGDAIPAGRTFWPEKTYVILQSSSSIITMIAAVSVGTNSPNYDNLCPATALTGLTAVGNKSVIQATATGLLITGVAAGGSDLPVYARISVAQSVGTGTVQVILKGMMDD